MCTLLEIHRGLRTQEFVFYKEESGNWFSGDTHPDVALKAMQYATSPSPQVYICWLFSPSPAITIKEVIYNTSWLHRISYPTMFYRVTQSKKPSQVLNDDQLIQGHYYSWCSFHRWVNRSIQRLRHEPKIAGARRSPGLHLPYSATVPDRKHPKAHRANQA